MDGTVNNLLWLPLFWTLWLYIPCEVSTAKTVYYWSTFKICTCACGDFVRRHTVIYVWESHSLSATTGVKWAGLSHTAGWTWVPGRSRDEVWKLRAVWRVWFIDQIKESQQHFFLMYCLNYSFFVWRIKQKPQITQPSLKNDAKFVRYFCVGEISGCLCGRCSILRQFLHKNVF